MSDFRPRRAAVWLRLAFAFAGIIVASLLIISTPAQAQKPGMAFWTISRDNQCEVMRAWTGQEVTRTVQNAINDLPNPKAFPRALALFHGTNFTDYFGKTYAQLTKGDKKKLMSLAQKCATRGAHMYGVGTALDTSSDRRTEDGRQAMRDSIANVNSPRFLAEIEKGNRYRRRAEVRKSEFDGKHFAHDDGIVFFEDDLVRLYWPRTIENVFDGPCEKVREIHVEYKRGHDFAVTWEVLATTFTDKVVPAIQRECGRLSGQRLWIRTYIDNTYLDYNGKMTTKAAILYRGLEGPLAQAWMTPGETYTGPEQLGVFYSAYPSPGDYRQTYTDYFAHVASISASQRFIADGRLMPDQALKKRQQAAIVAANPDWPFKVPDQDRYVLAGNFKGLTAGSFKNSKPFPNLRLVVAYLEAYSAQCAARSRLATRDLIVTRNVRTGQSTMYLPFKNAPTLLTQQEYQKETSLFAKVREDQIPLVQAIQKWGGTGSWPAFRVSESNSLEARLQRDRVTQLGCDTSAMRAYEAKLSAFAAKVNSL